MENCIYIDRRTKTIKNGRIDTFDEVHFSATKRPQGPQQLYNVGLRNEVITNETLPVTIQEKIQLNKPAKNSWCNSHAQM